MIDLKPYYDNVLNGQAAVQMVIAEIDDLMKLGTKEGEEQALALEPKLDEAVANAEKAQAFYDKLLKASKTSNVVNKFIPIQDQENPDGDDWQGKAMKRSEWQALDTASRARFIRGGGLLED